MNMSAAGVSMDIISLLPGIENIRLFVFVVKGTGQPYIIHKIVIYTATEISSSIFNSFKGCPSDHAENGITFVNKTYGQ